MFEVGEEEGPESSPFRMGPFERVVGEDSEEKALGQILGIRGLMTGFSQEGIDGLPVMPADFLHGGVPGPGILGHQYQGPPSGREV